MIADLNFTDQSLPKVSTLVELLRQRAQNQPDKTAYIFLENGESEAGSLTYAQLDQLAGAIASYLQHLVYPGERALLLYPSGLEFIAAFFGCLYAGVIAVPAYPPRQNQRMSRLQAIVADAQAKVTLTTDALLNNIQEQFAKHTDLAALHCLATDHIDIDRVKLWQETALNGNSLAFLQYTSGSTGTPKGVMVSHENLLYNEQMIQVGFGHTQKTIFVGWLPLFHDMGLIGNILQPLYLGIPCIFMPPSAFLQKPLRWLQAISHYQATTSGGPNFAYDMCIQKITPEQLQSLDLSSWQVAFNGAETVRDQTLEKFAATFAPCSFRKEAFYPCYGMAETTLFVSGGISTQPPVVQKVQVKTLKQNRVVTEFDEREDTRSIVGCGQTWLDQKIVIVNPETLNQCAADEIGEIWISGSNVAQGYWNRPEQTQQTFQAHIANTGVSEAGQSPGPFLRTGDLGFLKNGELFVTGRFKDVVIIRGRNHYPQDIELTVQQSHPALCLNSGAAFAVDIAGKEQLVIVQEVERSYLRKLNVNEVIGAIRRTVAEHHELEVYAIDLLKTMSLPKTSSGKVQHSACRAEFLARTLDVVAEWSASPPHKTVAVEEKQPLDSSQSNYRHQQTSHRVEEIEAWLIAKISEQLACANEIDIRQPLVNYGLSSLLAVSISGELQEWLKCEISPTLLYDYPTIASLAWYLGGSETESNLEKKTLQLATTEEPIAIIGIGCRFPQAKDPQSFWQLLCNGVNAVKEMPASRWDIDTFSPQMLVDPTEKYLAWGGYLEDVDRFDPQFFGISPREAELMDPQQRLLLTVTWEALENAGQIQEHIAGSLTGVFIGISNYDYSRLQFNSGVINDAYHTTGNAFSIAANRLSYLLDLRGPSWAVDTACSSSLVAVHQACQSLRQRESHLALAGGVNIILTPDLTLNFSQAGMLSTDGRCKTFDAKADGYVRGEGCGVVVLKRLSDALRDGDNILAVIRGSAVNQDGRSNGLTAPNGFSQQAVIRQALENAKVQPAEISYVEAHGTGTSLGDPIELNSIKKVLLEGRFSQQPCWIGSVKTNIGHLEAAAGIAGLIKVVLCLQHQEIPAHLHLTQINPYISLENTPLAIPIKRQKWSGNQQGRLAGVSSFGFGGTNAHVILEEAQLQPIQKNEQERFQHILTLSAKTETSLYELAQAYEAYLQQHPEVLLADICYTANTRRSHFDYRLYVVSESTEQLLAQLKAFAAGTETVGLLRGQINSRKRPKIAFLFTGQGSQYIGMGRQLYEQAPTFRKALEECDRILRSDLQKHLLEILYPSTGESFLLDETAYTQPALFALEYALFQLWQSWGITPNVVMGHSVGEYAAACAAGVFSLEDGLKLISARARLMQALPQDGEMVVVFASQEQVAAVISPYAQLAIAAINGFENIVISGKRESVKAAISTLESQGIQTRNLKVSHAFHSPLMEPMLAEFERVAKEVKYSYPRLDIISNVTGEVAKAEIATPEYWCRHIRQPVQFAAGITNLHQQGYELFLEIGPKPTLLGMGRHCLPNGWGIWLPSLRPRHSDWQYLLQSLGELYIQGLSVNWLNFDRDHFRRFLNLPTYPFQQKRYWLPTSHRHYPINVDRNNHQELTQLLQQAAELLPKLLKLVNTSQPQQSSPTPEIKPLAEPEQPWLIEHLEKMPANERLSFVISHIQREVSTVLHFDPTQLPEPKLGFFDMGMDSMRAVELKQRLEKSLGVTISSTLAFNYPNIESIAKYLLSDVIGLDLMSNSNVQNAIACKVEQLSEEEAEALLVQKLANLFTKN